MFYLLLLFLIPEVFVFLYRHLIQQLQSRLRQPRLDAAPLLISYRIQMISLVPPVEVTEQGGSGGLDWMQYFEGIFEPALGDEGADGVLHGVAIHLRDQFNGLLQGAFMQTYFNLVNFSV